jgi:N-acetylglutamate synthase-like GNAT family acetyltransferase
MTLKVQQKSNKVLASYAKHLKNLSPDDRYTRFCYHIRDEQIDQLILQILYNQDDHYLFTATDNDTVVGFGHLARDGDNWELAVSVNSDRQGQGIGNQIMSYMIPWAQIHGVHNVFMHCITQNQKIQHLATKHGLQTIEKDSGEITSKVELPPPTPMDYSTDFMREQRDLAQQIIDLQHQMIKNLNPLVFVNERKLD